MLSMLSMFHKTNELPFGLEPPTDYVHPGVAGLQKQRSQLHIAHDNISPPPVRGSTPAPDPAAPVDPDADAWNPGVSQEPSGVIIPTAQINRWKSTHQTHHEFYELDWAMADLVSFQVKLHGTIPTFKDRKYTYNSKSSTWHSVYFRKAHNPDIRKLTLDWQRI
ncbi:hypothetical protein AAF712_014467 [Marasmius tenuissimus]|uniref:Uncharacterized protein n=1 Tax=Marasmius tenuissimus TaxID=585030 RepID=A0ABR2ZBX1_9AGAR